MSGQVYVLTNIAMPGLVKVGHSIDAVTRAKQLSSATGVPCDFDVAYVQDVDFAYEAESLAHAELADRRVNERREFFYTSSKTASEAVQLAALEVLWDRSSDAAREQFLKSI
jgi:hypothetical protein